MLTKDDIKLLIDNFPTRAEFEYKLEKLRSEMATKDELREVKGLVESVYTEIKNMREEQAMHLSLHSRINDDINSIKKRVGKLESSSVSIPH